MRLTFWPFIPEAGSLQHSGSAASDGLTVCLNSKTVAVVCSQPQTDTISEMGSVTGTGPSTSARLLAAGELSGAFGKGKVGRHLI